MYNYWCAVSQQGLLNDVQGFVGPSLDNKMSAKQDVYKVKNTVVLEKVKFVNVCL